MGLHYNLWQFNSYSKPCNDINIISWLQLKSDTKSWKIINVDAIMTFPILTLLVVLLTTSAPSACALPCHGSYVYMYTTRMHIYMRMHTEISLTSKVLYYLSLTSCRCIRDWKSNWYNHYHITNFDTTGFYYLCINLIKNTSSVSYR